MAKNTAQITASGQAIVGPGRLLGILVCSHSSGTVKLIDSPNSNIGRVLLDTFTFATGSSYVPLGGIEYYEGINLTAGGTSINIQLVTTPDMGGVIN